MEPASRCEETPNLGWHASEKRIENLLSTYFGKRGYKVALHCCQDQFDLAAAKVNGSKIETLTGIEIKSKNDTLNRLDSQMVEYIQIFDLIYVALEAQQLPVSLPSFVGVIYISDENIALERKAHRIGRALFPWCITDSALTRTIKTSNGIQNRCVELKAYLSVLDDLRRKLLYNCIFWNDPLPLTDQEKCAIDFIEQKLSSISKLGLFTYECGKARVMGEQYGKQRY
jgi:hypothetical protein